MRWCISTIATWSAGSRTSPSRKMSKLCTATLRLPDGKFIATLRLPDSKFNIAAPRLSSNKFGDAPELSASKFDATPRWPGSKFSAAKMRENTISVLQMASSVQNLFSKKI